MSVTLPITVEIRELLHLIFKTFPYKCVRFFH